MTPKYRAVLIDLDDTIFDNQFHRREALAALARSVPELSLTDMRDLERVHELHLQRTHQAVLDGSIMIAEARIERMRALLSDSGLQADTALAEKCEAIYRGAYDREWRPVPGATELLQSLRELGVWLGVITNGHWGEQTAKMQRLGLERAVDEMIVSETVGSRKPAREFFSHAVERSGLRPSECVVVGDLWETDIQGALDCGLDAIWLNRYGLVRPAQPTVVEVQALTPTAAILKLFLDGPR